MAKWAIPEEAWNKGVAVLRAFKEREGHCAVPRFHLEDGYRLGQWVAVQRYTQGSLAPRRKVQLDKIGFLWSQRDQWWEKKFAALKAFKAREGHCYVPAHHIEGSVHLGHWVTVQRRRRKKMSRERKQRLESIGFIWDGRITMKVKRIRGCFQRSQWRAGDIPKHRRMSAPSTGGHFQPFPRGFRDSR